MEKTFPGNEFRELLRLKLKNGIQKNPAYSLRSLAKQLEVSASSLSMVMNGRCPVTLQFIEKVGKRLKIDEEEIHKYQMNLLIEKSNIIGQKEFEVIGHDRLALIKEWYHYAILNLMRVKGFRPQPQWIAKRLNLTLGEVQSAIERLQKVGILKIEGKIWRDVSSKFTSHSNNKKYSEAARENQMQLFKKAIEAIEQVSFENRYHSGVTLAMSESELTEAKEYIANFRKDFMKKFDKENEADGVYHISIGLFPLTKMRD